MGMYFKGDEVENRLSHQQATRLKLLYMVVKMGKNKMCKRLVYMNASQNPISSPLFVISLPILFV
ncbi:uncharacterized protein MELLADRAFT_57749 [Melampsora larici-populina 98AG31]|uniref:Uncharacterized protein n=1 Tax=Melampsora larici-populina (strain 98AG31 / pathotype 3-4-7) TaxID=747676 RepID=F4S693_MELLP|nr:uncharacterized protein MELLADRAFT_57749 [Melampsora larici-populina 98AG31]EGF99839.1 hypothetical protein MELLADRAFT_57749 [Melampsora larici-populina 98AG31]